MGSVTIRTRARLRTRGRTGVLLVGLGLLAPAWLPAATGPDLPQIEVSTGTVDAAAPVRIGLDPARLFARAVAMGSAGDHSLARTCLEPVLLSPRVSRSARARAYYLRGLLFYRDGAYVSAGQDYRRALEFMPTLAEARTALAWLHLNGLGVDQDGARARHLYRLAARQGHADARFNLALLLAKGEHGPRREREAISWFVAAAEAGREDAGTLAGRLLARQADDARGDSERRAADLERARSLLAHAADQGDTSAMLTLTSMLVDHAPTEALRWLESAASQGVVVAQRRLGELLQRGGEGIDPDPERAATWLREAAKQGDPSAQAWLGWAYDTGTGVPRDAGEAVRWYTRAARGDVATAQVNLAALHQYDPELAPRPDLARYWFERAAENGEVGALSSLAWLLSTAPDPADRDGDRALELARAAVAEQTDSRTLEALAAALAESGRFDEAVAEQRRALALLDEKPDLATDRDALEARLATYRAERAWRER